MANLMDNVQNMNKKTRLVLSIVGISAVLVPAILLFTLSKLSVQEPQVGTGKRSVDTASIERSVKAIPTPKPLSSPKASTPSAAPRQGTSSAR